MPSRALLQARTMAKTHRVDASVGSGQADPHMYPVIPEGIHALGMIQFVVDRIHADGIDEQCLHQWRVEGTLGWIG